MSSLKRAVYRVIGESTLYRGKRVLRKWLSGRKNVDTALAYRTISVGHHTSCGYYDWDPVRDGTLLLTASDKRLRKATVCGVDLATLETRPMAETVAVNWQQGCRLRWVAENRLLYNDFQGGQYVCVEVADGEERVHPYPVYDATAEVAVSLDFERLGRLRPGYGYTLRGDHAAIGPETAAMRVYRVRDDALLAEIPYRALMDALALSVKLDACYVNHVSFSPDGSQFLFFFVEIVGGRHLCRMGVYRMESGKIAFAETALSVSHYTWKDAHTILATAYDDRRRCGYYLYTLPGMSRETVMPDKLKQDGHPTYINPGQFITDTYPDAAGYQELRLVTPERDEVRVLARLYSTARHLGENRCDLHPRYSARAQAVFVDADIRGRRKVYQFDWKTGEEQA